jgi:dTDP-4-dehydrorhamnose reductase
MNTIIIGSSGKIGRYFFLKRKKNQILTYFNNKIKEGIKFDLNSNNISKILKKHKIEKAVIMSAYSEPDFCKKNKKISNKLNVIQTKKLITTLIKKNIYFIFFSSEQIFDGIKGNYNEKDTPKPINLYGKQKYEIEKFIQKTTQNFCIFRIAKTYSDNLNDSTLIGDFLKKSKNNITINAAEDQKFSPLYVLDLVKITNTFLNKKIKGIFNIGGKEKISRYNLYKNFNRCLLKNKNYQKVKLYKKKLKDFDFYEKRPGNLTFNIKKLTVILDFDLVSIKQVFLKIIK